MTRGINLRPMGAAAAEAAAAQEKGEAMEASILKAYASEACVDCGKFGSWFDGDFHYCADHVPHSLRHRGSTWREDVKKTNG